VWVGYLLANPLRRLVQNPLTILGLHVQPGMMVMDVGPGMGFFSLPLARLVGAKGRVVCVDVQAAMLERLRRRARKAGLAERIETRLCVAGSPGLEEFRDRMDFVLAFAVVHEAPDSLLFLEDIASVLKAGGRLLLAEPKAHVPEAEFRVIVQGAVNAGLRIAESPRIWRARAVLMEKGEDPGPSWGGSEGT
jgi:ubiquinone/menaquinone biosynthesis C-methylase UbiE